MEGKGKEAGMGNKGETRTIEENEKEVKKKRRRQEKEAKQESKKALCLRKFLNKKEKSGFEIEFRERKKIDHSLAEVRNTSSRKIEGSNANGRSDVKRNEVGVSMRKRQ